MLLDWSSLVHLKAGAYEAWVAPHAGGRLCRLIWHGPQGDRDLVVPVEANGTFDSDAWPKQGAFPMLPFTNRLANARFNWLGETHSVRAVPGQVHGLHGMGHRQRWDVLDSGTNHVTFGWHHQAEERTEEWPWSFTAEMTYRVDGELGLDLSLALRNDSATASPAILGWHPYAPGHWLAAATGVGNGSALHDLGSDGLHFPTCSREPLPSGPIAIDLQAPHTLAVEGWSSTWKLRMPDGEQWRLDSDAEHLVHHVPASLDYACIEPVTSLPGTLQSPDAADEATLEPGHWRRLNCRLRID